MNFARQVYYVIKYDEVIFIDTISNFKNGVKASGTVKDNDVYNIPNHVIINDGKGNDVVNFETGSSCFIYHYLRSMTKSYYVVNYC